MEGKKPFTLPVLSMVLLILLIISPTMACPQQGTECKDCILDQMKYASRSKCIKKCNCNGGKPTLSDCKKCMSRCKCSCAAAAAA
ncbi:hypothetical protein P3X46_034008 [Hevea brasiliensis]|uniref:Uncharacterized protein n=1 Tax=Hevea brasiliensis TaxID=3981 RepID=A0ABQ9KEF6_HEVBR|nr:hypothetical protein P3X46_034008 [Hevea brasiliensis]